MGGQSKGGLLRARAPAAGMMLVGVPLHFAMVPDWMRGPLVSLEPHACCPTGAT
jgi:hypothetical protein